MDKRQYDRLYHRIYDATPERKYLRYKKDLERRIFQKSKQIYKLEEFLNAQENTYRDGEKSGI